MPVKKDKMVHPPLIHKVYLAGPLECCSRISAISWREDVENQLRKKGKIYSLIPGFDTTDNEPDSINWLDFQMIDISEAVLVNLTYLAEGIVGTGTLIELGYAKAKQKMIVGYTEKKWPNENRFLRGILTRLFDNRQQTINYLIGFNHRKELKKIM